jgi:hypothetical protein
VRHHYAPLAVVAWNPTTAQFSDPVTDVRARLPALTALRADDVAYTVAGDCVTQLSGLPPNPSVADALAAICKKTKEFSAPNATQVTYQSTGPCQTLLGPQSNVAAALDQLCQKVSDPTSIGALPIAGGTVTGSITGGGANAQNVRIRDGKQTQVQFGNLPITGNATLKTVDDMKLQITVVSATAAPVPILIRFFMGGITPATGTSDSVVIFRLFVDNIEVALARERYLANSAQGGAFETHSASLEYFTQIGAGTHSVEVRWAVTSTAGSTTAQGCTNRDYRQLVAIEL